MFLMVKMLSLLDLFVVDLPNGLVVSEVMTFSIAFAMFPLFIFFRRGNHVAFEDAAVDGSQEHRRIRRARNCVVA